MPSISDGVGSDSAGSDGVGSDGVGSDGVGSDGVGSDSVGSDSVGSDSAGSDGVGSDGVGSDSVGSDGVGSDGVGSDGVGSDGVGSDGVGSDGVGSDGVGSGSVGSDGVGSDSVWLITGAPGAGKSTVSKGLARRLPRSAHVETDLVREMIVSGCVNPGEEPLAESNAQLGLGAHNAALMADSLMNDGFTPIIDDVILRPQMERYREVLSRWPLRFVVLAPPVEVAIERDSQRVEKHVAQRFAYLDAELRLQMQGLGLWLDTSGMTPGETVEAIVRRADEALLGPPPR